MKIAVIGCGVMGNAFAKHFAKNHAVILFDRNVEKAMSLAKQIGGNYAKTLPEAIQSSDVVLLAVKPKDLVEVAQEAASAFHHSKILMSILAGTPLVSLRRHFPEAMIVRSMPNLGLICGQGVVGLVDDGSLSIEVKKQVDALIEGMGLSAWMSEDKIEAMTALSGSGIGFVLVMIEAMIDGGVHLGFTAEQSREIVLKTMDGAVALVRTLEKHPAEIKLQISSPGGTTIAGLNVMEEKGVRSGIIETLIACYEKAMSMRSID